MTETRFDVAVERDRGVKIIPVGDQWQAEVWDKGARIGVRKFATRVEANSFKDHETKKTRSLA